MTLAIDRTPTDVIAAFTRKTPVDVYGLANALGLEVVQDATLSDRISGKIERSWSGSVTITVNANHSKTRQRFTVAHEIAHFVLHRDEIGDGIKDDALYRSDLSEAIERQASSYAATILMPAPEVREAFARGVDTPIQLAQAFKVSPKVAEIRMKELRLHVARRAGDLLPL